MCVCVSALLLLTQRPPTAQLHPRVCLCIIDAVWHCIVMSSCICAQPFGVTGMLTGCAATDANRNLAGYFLHRRYSDFVLVHMHLENPSWQIRLKKTQTNTVWLEMYGHLKICACWTCHIRFSHSFAVIRTFTLLGRLFARCWMVDMGICAHSDTRALVRSVTRVWVQSVF